MCHLIGFSQKFIEELEIKQPVVDRAKQTAQEGVIAAAKEVHTTNSELG